MDRSAAAAAALAAAATAESSPKRRRVDADTDSTSADEPVVAVAVVDAAVELRVSIPEPALTMLQTLLDDVQGTRPPVLLHPPPRTICLAMLLSFY